MKEICVVPTFQREELLWLTLEAIRREDSTVPIYVFSDRGADSLELSETCETFFATLTVVDPHTHYGNSWNVLESCKLMLRVFPELEILHLIEDDTILHPSYFTWARGKLASGQYQAVCGHIGNTLDTWYTSPCASWNASRLRECMPLIPEGYFADTVEEMYQVMADCPHFLQSKYRYGSVEQDGFFLRCIEKFSWHTYFPPKPLCTHLGTVGYNRPTGPRPVGDLQERVSWYRTLLLDTDRRKEFFGVRITEMEISS